MHKIFDIMQTSGNISDKEMYRTFNMGIGFILVVNKTDVIKIIKKLHSLGEKAFVIGHIEKGHAGVSYV